MGCSTTTYFNPARFGTTLKPSFTSVELRLAFAKSRVLRRKNRGPVGRLDVLVLGWWGCVVFEEVASGGVPYVEGKGFGDAEA